MYVGPRRQCRHLADIYARQIILATRIPRIHGCIGCDSDILHRKTRGVWDETSAGWLNLNTGSLIRPFFTWFAARARLAEGIQLGLANCLVVIVRGLHSRVAPANMSLWHPRKALVQETARDSVRGTARSNPSTLDTIGTTRITSACAPFPSSRFLQTDRF